MAVNKEARIVNTGDIVGDTMAIVNHGFGGTIIKNSGKIVGSVDLNTIGNTKVVNSGVIHGDVRLAKVESSYDGRKGAVDGVVSGGHDDDRLRGGSDSDHFAGEGGRDELRGGGGDDVLVGGARGDHLSGGSGKDIFVYQSDNDLGSGDDGYRDTIRDFSHSDGDRIDLSAVPVEGGKLHFIGTAEFSGTAGEVRYEVEGNHVLVQASLDGFGLTDLEIKLANVSAMQAHDFIL